MNIFFVKTKCAWYKFSKKHRLNAPAVIETSGHRQYWEFGEVIK
jgi:hypothetical protein